MQQNKQHAKSQWNLTTLRLGKGVILLTVDTTVYLPCSHGKAITGLQRCINGNTLQRLSPSQTLIKHQYQPCIHSQSSSVGSGLSTGPVALRHFSQVPHFLPQLFQAEKEGRGTGLFCKVCEMKWGKVLGKNMALIIYLSKKGTLDRGY